MNYRDWRVHFVLIVSHLRLWSEPVPFHRYWVKTHRFPNLLQDHQIWMRLKTKLMPTSELIIILLFLISHINKSKHIQRKKKAGGRNPKWPTWPPGCHFWVRIHRLKRAPKQGKHAFRTKQQRRRKTINCRVQQQSQYNNNRINSRRRKHCTSRQPITDGVDVFVFIFIRSNIVGKVSN